MDTLYEMAAHLFWNAAIIHVFIGVHIAKPVLSQESDEQFRIFSHVVLIDSVQGCKQKLAWFRVCIFSRTCLLFDQVIGMQHESCHIK